MLRIIPYVTILLLLACNNERNVPDVSAIKVDLVIERFEQDFFKVDTNALQAGLDALNKKYPRFYPLYLQNILQVAPADPAASFILKSIIGGYRPINDSIQKKYGSLSWLKDDLESSFKFVKHYYPAYATPRIITFIGTLDAPGAVVTPDYLGIGLHQFGGKDFSVYQDPQVQQMYPNYIARRFDQEYMTAAAMKAVADDIYTDVSTGLPLIEQMVEKGKAWYLLDHFLPHAPDSVKTGFTKKQLDWLNENEGNAWAYVTKNEDIYSIEPHVIQTYIGEAPFTQGMTESSPGNIGQWIGLQIIQKFAAANTDLTLQQVLAMPARKIFEGSKYRPK
jgi:hypothetical protein